MSIKIENPETVLEKIGAIDTYLQQMKLAKTLNDDAKYNLSEENVIRLVAESMEMLNKLSSDIKCLNLWSDENTYNKYYELLWAVTNKYPNEDRHQTALRIIKESEKGSTQAYSSKESK